MMRALTRSLAIIFAVLASVVALLGVAQAARATPRVPVPPPGTLVAQERSTYLTPVDSTDPANASKVMAICTLYNNLWFYPDTYTITVWANTECDTTVASIEHAHEIQRSRWFGWETMASRADPVQDVGFNTSWLATSLSYACGGTGIHDYRAGVSAVVRPYASEPLYGTVITELDEINCG